MSAKIKLFFSVAVTGGCEAHPHPSVVIVAYWQGYSQAIMDARRDIHPHMEGF